MSKVMGIRVLIFVIAWARWKGLGRGGSAVVAVRVGCVGDDGEAAEIGLLVGE